MSAVWWGLCTVIRTVVHAVVRFVDVHICNAQYRVPECISSELCIFDTLEDARTHQTVRQHEQHPEDQEQTATSSSKHYVALLQSFLYLCVGVF